jgi:parallel beta-helix repeat protein
MLKSTMIICMILLLCIPTFGGARTYIVGNDAVATHKSIGQALAAASDGDTIYMKSGIYNEEVTIDKKVAIKPLTGEKGIILLNGSGKETGIKITADGCSIEGLVLKNYTQAGIMIESNGNTIENSQFVNDAPGVMIKGSSQNVIEGNSMRDCKSGVVSWLGASQNKISNNNIEGGISAIILKGSRSDIVIDNKLSKGGAGVALENSSAAKISMNIIRDSIAYGINVYNGSDCSLTNNIYLGNKWGIYFTNTSRTELSNESIKNAQFGITLENSSDNIIRKCNISNTKQAMGLRTSLKNSISDNSIWNTADVALDVEYSNSNSITGNRITKGDGGIIVVESSANKLESNKLNEISQALLVEGSGRPSFDNAIDESNTIDGKPIVYIYGQSDKRIAGREMAHLTLAYCSNFTLEKNTITHDALFLFGSKSNRIAENNVSNAYGILLYDSNQNEVYRNTMKGNKFSGIYIISSNSNNLSQNIASQNNQNGISLRSSNANNIRSNVLDRNNNSGIWLNEANDNQIFENTISSNPTGALLINSSENQVYHNNFVNNAEQAEDRDGTNSWDKGSEMGGNYWSDYLATGNPSKGMSRVIKGDKMDNYPFQNQNGWATPGTAVPIPTVSSMANASTSTTNQSIGNESGNNSKANQPAH